MQNWVIFWHWQQSQDSKKHYVMQTLFAAFHLNNINWSDLFVVVDVICVCVCVWIEFISVIWVLFYIYIYAPEKHFKLWIMTMFDHPEVALCGWQDIKIQLLITSLSFSVTLLLSLSPFPFCFCILYLPLTLKRLELVCIHVYRYDQFGSVSWFLFSFHIGDQFCCQNILHVSWSCEYFWRNQ